MLRATDDCARPPSRAIARLSIALLWGLAVAASTLRGSAWAALAVPPVSGKQPVEVSPFDVSLVWGDDPDADGVFGVRPAAILKRPGAEPILRLVNAGIDSFFSKGGEWPIHAEDVEQILGRLRFSGKNVPGQRALDFTVRALRTTKDIDWVKLRDRFDPEVKQRHWKGETYVSVPQAWAALAGMVGVQLDTYLWARDARTLLLDRESHIKAQIDAKAAGTRPPIPVYAEGWDQVSRGLFAVAVDKRGRRLVPRTMTDAELKEAAVDPTGPECHAVHFYQKVSGLIVGFAGNDDFRLDLRASADTPEAAAEMAHDCKAFRAAAAQTNWTATTDIKEAAMGAFLRKVIERAAVRRDGTTVTVHAEVPSGFDAFITSYMKLCMGMNAPPGSPK
jgi:hypothetical protein